MSKYVVEQVPSKWLKGKVDEPVYYCHKEGLDNIPVFGSIGDKQKAKDICRLMNGR